MVTKTIVRKNERSWAIELISEINIMLSTMGLTVKRAGGENTLSTKESNMFPDVLLYSDIRQTQIIQGWELKLPDTLITDETFIKDAERKARALSLNSFFIWNFTTGVLYIKDKDDIYMPAKTWNGTNYIKDRSGVDTYKDDWIALIKKIMIEINEYLITGKIKASKLGDIVSDSLMLSLINRNKHDLANYIKDVCKTRAVIQSKLNVWWAQVKSEYISDEPDVFHAYSKVILLNWTNRLVFANLIKRYYNIAKSIEDVDSYDITPDNANAIICDITKTCDFFNVFSTMEYSELLPDNVWQDIIDFNVFLKNNGINYIAHTALQAILENSVAMTKREIRGQFTTPPTLAEFLVKTTVQDWTGICSDPCCGTGTIAKAILNNKIEKTGIAKAYETTWASDKYSFPLQVSNISLTNTEAINIPCRLFQENVFNLNLGKEIDIINPKDGETLRISYPSFKAIVSNLPFVAFEFISDDEKSYVEKIKTDTAQPKNLFLESKGDLYSYIPFHLWNIIENNGRLGIITSNSWLGTDWGYSFFNILSYYYDIKSVIISTTEKWFSNADVITTILILEKKSISKPGLDSKISFCTLKKSLIELEASPDMMNLAIDSVIISQELDEQILALKDYSFEQIYSLSRLGVSYNALFHNVDWLIEISEKLIPINKLFIVSRGERRGQNDMFYPESNHGIEKNYIRPVLKNPKNLKNLIGNTDISAFCCSLSTNELEEKGHYGAIKWIRKFESSVNGRGRPLPEVLRKPNAFWYEMTDSAKADMVTILNPNERLFVARFAEPTFVDQRFTKLNKINDNINLDLCHALINSMLGMFYIEAIGFGRGLGVLDTSSTNFKKIFMLNPNLLTNEQAQKIIDAFKPLLQRDVLDTEREVLSKDRECFDRTVLECYDILDYYEPIRHSLLSMQRTRLSANK